MSQSLVTTPPDSAQPLQFNGRSFAAMHKLIVGILRNRLGENHESLLAAPKLLSDGSIAWSTPLGGAVTPAGELPGDERNKLSKRAERLLDDIRGLSAARSIKTAPISEVSSTPLADGLAQTGRMVDGVKRAANIPLIRDGEGSCQGGPCAAAAAHARAKPRLKINVVDITGTGAASSVASAIEGTVYTARNAAETTAMMQRASQDAMAPRNASAEEAANASTYP